jgi:hypothetical protein
MAGKDKQKGAQTHAEGQHGEKTHEALLDQLQNPQTPRDTDRVEQEGSPYGVNPSDGKHRVNREQHDEAEKNSELTRGHDREQGPHS